MRRSVALFVAGTFFLVMVLVIITVKMAGNLSYYGSNYGPMRVFYGETSVTETLVLMMLVLVGIVMYRLAFLSRGKSPS